MNTRIIPTLMILTLIAMTACSTASNTTSKAEYVFGAVLPLTGPAAFYGEFSRAGIALAIEDVNAAGGINGKPVRVVFEDGPDKQAASTAANKLINLDGVDAIFSSTTGMSGVTAPVAEAAGVPMIYAAATDSFAKNSTYIFKDYPGAEDECELSMNHMVADGHTTTALIGANAEYTMLCKEGASRVQAPTVVEMYNPGETDFKTQMTKIKESGATAILVSMIAHDCPHMFKEIRELEMDQDIYIMFQSVGCGSPSNTESYGHLMQGAYGADILVDEDDAAFASFKKNLIERKWITQITGSAILYDAVMTMAHAYEGCEDTKCVTENIRTTKDFKGVTGSISYNGQLVERQMMLSQLEGKEWKKVE